MHMRRLRILGIRRSGDLVIARDLVIRNSKQSKGTNFIGLIVLETLSWRAGMNRLASSFCTMVLFAVPLASAQKGDDCYTRVKSQFELNQCAGQKDDAADRELNKTYREILTKYSDQPEFLQRMREAQRIWLQLRDAELKMKYPLDRDMYGSVQPMCEASYREELTKERTKQLKKWLTGIAEGDVCSGSVKRPEQLK